MLHIEILLFLSVADHPPSLSYKYTTVQRAVELNAADPNGKSDPYCVIHLGSPGEQLFKTDVNNGTLNPEWNESYTIQNKQRSPYVFTAGKTVIVILIFCQVQ